MVSRMKRILLAATLLAVGAVSCTSCAGKTPTPSGPDAAPSASVTPIPPTPVPVNTDITVKQDNWEFVLPTSAWDQAVTCSQTGCPVAYMSKDKKAIVVFVSEKTNATYDQFVLMSLRGIKDAGANIASAKQIDLNGHKFVLVESSKNGVKVWMWVTLINGTGYGLSCGGPADNHDLCFGVANTLKIN